MANEEQINLLRQGAEVWNEWRKKNSSIEIELDSAILTGTDLSGVNLSKANLKRANLSITNLNRADLAEANLTEVNFNRAQLNQTNLTGADLREAYFFLANLRYAYFFGANLTNANFRETNLTGVNFVSANLNGADFTGANLTGADFTIAEILGINLTRAILIEANLTKALLGSAIFSGIDLSKTYGLEKIVHESSSTIGTNTIQLSKGAISDVFLRGCGLSDLDIEHSKLYKPDLSNKEIDEILYRIHDIRAQQSIQISPLFISYSHADTFLVEKLEFHLTKLGIRFWRDVHNATAGRLETQIDRAMRQNPTVLLVLSKNSTASDWVEHEARLVRELEKEIRRDVLCPIALDDSWKTAQWPARLMEQIKEYNILDFSKWEDDKSFEQVFTKMINGLDMFYKPESAK